MISLRIVLVGLTAMLACFARSAEPLKIGMVVPLTGPAAESGRYQAQGAKLAAEEVNKAGGVLGRPIELVIEDDQTTNPGIVLAFSKLAGDKDIPAFIGSVRSTQVHAMAPDIQRLGKPVMIGGTDPQLTHMGNPWLFRFRPNDLYSAQVIGAMTMGVGAALSEGLAIDKRLGLFVNHDLAGYEVAVHADIPHQEVIFLDEVDPISSPMKAKGIGELGLCGVGAAIANAIYNATGVRVRDYPITVDKLIDRLPEMVLA